MSKAQILADIRAALNRKGPVPASVAKGLEERLRNPTPNLQPKLGAATLETFIAKLALAGGKFTRVADYAAMPGAVLEHLNEFGLTHDVLVAPDPLLDEIPWSNQLSIQRRAATGDDKVSITSAYAGVAETGSVVLLSGPQSPTTLNFLPEDHLVVLPIERLVDHLEDVWAKFRASGLAMPRTINVISGPSKTADVAQTLQEGAHGPRRLRVILVG